MTEPMETGASASPSSRTLYVIIGSLVLASCLCYANALGWDSFHLDDKYILTDRLALEPSEGRSSLEEFIDVIFMPTARNRPVANASFALSYWLGGGLSSPVFRLGNLLVHALTAVVIFFFVRRLLNLPRALADPWRPARGWMVAWAVAMIWTVHPIQVQAVTYVVQRMTSLATLFSLLSILLFLKGWETGQGEPRIGGARGRRILWFGLSALAFALGLGSKEAAALAIPSLGLLVWTLGLPQSEPREHSSGESGDRDGLAMLWVAGASTVVIGGLAVLYTHGTLGDYLAAYVEAPVYRDYSGIERLLTQGRVLLHYVGLLLLPLPGFLNIDHHVQHSQGLFSPAATILGLALMAGGLAAGAVLRRKHSLLSYGILFFILHHAVESLHPSLEMMFEHRNYAPSIGLILAVVVLVSHSMRAVRPRFVALVAAVVVVLLSSATYSRNQAWETGVTLWQDAVEKSPGKYRPSANLAIELLKEYKERRDSQDQTPTEAESLQYVRDGMRYAQRALSIGAGSRSADVSAAHENLSHWHEAMGNTRKALEEALQAERLGCESAWLLYHIGSLSYRLGKQAGPAAQADLDRAEEYYRQAITLNNASTVEAYFGMYHVASVRNDARLMMEMLEATLGLNPAHVNACVEMGQFHRHHGQRADAEPWFRKALDIDGTSQSALGNLAGLLCEDPARRREARPYLLKLLAIAPEHPQRAGIEAMLRRLE